MAGSHGFRRRRRGVHRAAPRRGRASRCCAPWSASCSSLVGPRTTSRGRRPARRARRDRPAAPTPDDPALARLLPDAYADDEEAAAEFRRFTERDLRDAKARDARTRSIARELAEQGREVVVDRRADRRPGSASSTTCGSRSAPGSDITEDEPRRARRPARRRPARRAVPGLRLADLPAGRPLVPARSCPSRLAVVPAWLARSRQDLVDAIVAHARADHPDEACGVIAGPGGLATAPSASSRWSTRRGRRRSTSSTRLDLLRLYREMDDRDEEPVVIYHSHTATEAYPPAPTSPTPPSRGPLRAGVAPARPARGRPRTSSGRTGSSTAWSPRRPVDACPVRRCALTSSAYATCEALARAARLTRQDSRQSVRRLHAMAIEVRIPTILRTYTDGEKVVVGRRRHRLQRRRRATSTAGTPGSQDRLVDDERPAPVRQRLPQRRGRALPRRPRDAGRRRRHVTILPAVAGGCSR